MVLHCKSFVKLCKCCSFYPLYFPLAFPFMVYPNICRGFSPYHREDNNLQVAQNFKWICQVIFVCSRNIAKQTARLSMWILYMQLADSGSAQQDSAWWRRSTAIHPAMWLSLWVYLRTSGTRGCFGMLCTTANWVKNRNCKDSHRGCWHNEIC